MKRKLLSVLTIAFSMTALMAQEKKTTYFNRWSIDLNAGSSKPSEPFDEKYYSDNFNFNHVDLGVRYMLNSKFGLKADVGFDNMKGGSNSKDFSTKYLRADLQGVVNLGRICDFETWTRVFGLQAHAGAGVSRMTNDNFKDEDNMANFIIGLTGQVKLSNRFALNADFSRISNVRQDYNFNGSHRINSDKAFDGVLYNATLGLSYYIGKQNVHADWYSKETSTPNSNDEILTQFSQLENKLNETEKKLASTERKLDDATNKLKDSDNDGVADYLDLEPNSKPGAIVDTKGRTIEQNKIKIETTSNDSSQDLNDVEVYFNSGSSKPTLESHPNIDVVADYLKSNQSVKAEINGYSDSTGGKTKGNDVLSKKRADVVKSILVKSGINSNRLSAHGRGVDSRTDNREKMRHVSFRIK